ncbi:hypothetical protein BC830DRAFT_698050 [Chytriomyces sp. MP71]|nr:hypothetical protein BC830DRAFT_698050 [Chytriomyces sp. MP71]
MPGAFMSRPIHWHRAATSDCRTLLSLATNRLEEKKLNSEINKLGCSMSSMGCNPSTQIQRNDNWPNSASSHAPCRFDLHFAYKWFQDALCSMRCILVEFRRLQVMLQSMEKKRSGQSGPK